MCSYYLIIMRYIGAVWIQGCKGRSLSSLTSEESSISHYELGLLLESAQETNAVPITRFKTDIKDSMNLYHDNPPRCLAKRSSSSSVTWSDNYISNFILLITQNILTGGKNQRKPYLIWSRCLRFSIPHDDERQHGTAVEDPRSEREEVNQRVYGSVQHHCHSYQRLKQYFYRLGHRSQQHFMQLSSCLK